MHAPPYNALVDGMVGREDECDASDRDLEQLPRSLNLGSTVVNVGHSILAIRNCQAEPNTSSVLL